MTSEPQDILEESVRIAADDGDLTGVLAYPLAGRPALAGLVVGPHPLMGGRLENNVVRSVGRGLAEYGMITLRFEFGGEGASAEVMERFWKTGQAPEDARREVDCAAAFRWLGQVCDGPTILIGYSFGASLLGNLAKTERVRGLVLIGATLVQHDYARVAASRLPKLLFAADNDFATPLAATRAWFETAASPKHLVVVQAAEHFYRGQESQIVQEIVQWLPM